MLKANGARVQGRFIRKFRSGTLQTDEENIRQFVDRKREYELVLGSSP